MTDFTANDQEIIDEMSKLSASQKIRWGEMMQAAWEQSDEMLTVEEKLRRDELQQQLSEAGVDTDKVQQFFRSC